MFADRSKGSATRTLAPARQLELPPRFEAIAEAVAAKTDACAACAELGRELGAEGVPLAEALDGLAQTYRIVCATVPDHQATVELAVAWSESTLRFVHQISCLDPATGVASQHHIRARVSEMYADRSAPHRVLVVAEIARHRAPGPWSRLENGIQIARAGESARTVFAQGEPVGRLGARRIVVLAQRDDRLGRRVGLLRRMLDTGTGGTTPDADAGADTGPAPRVWIEGLPERDASAGLLLDELSRAEPDS